MFKWAFIKECIWAPSVPYMLCSLERDVFGPCWVPTVETVVYYKQSGLSQRWKDFQSSKWQQISPNPGCSCLWVRLQIGACGEGRSRELTCLLTVKSVVLCSFMTTGTGCRNNPIVHGWLRNGPWGRETQILDTVEYIEELFKIWREIQLSNWCLPLLKNS